MTQSRYVVTSFRRATAPGLPRPLSVIHQDTIGGWVMPAALDLTTDEARDLAMRLLDAVADYSRTRLMLV